MEPLLLDGDELIVNTSPDGSYRVGDIVLYRSPNHPNPVAHRLVSVDRESSSAVFRSDANPLMTESLGINVILGKVEYVRRGGKLVRVNGTIATSLRNRGVALGRPAVLHMKDRAMAVLLPAVTSLQGARFYRRCAARLFTPQIRVVPSEGRNAARIVATINGRFAGSLDVDSRCGKGNNIGWISSLSVRARYRGAGIATSLLEAAERHAKEAGIQELWVEHARDNWLAEKLYRRMGFDVVEPCDSDNGNGALHRRKIIATANLARTDVG